MRPTLNRIPMSDALPPRAGACYATMLANQWDGVLQALYDLGFVLLELDDEERPLRAFRRPHRASERGRGSTTPRPPGDARAL